MEEKVVAHYFRRDLKTRIAAALKQAGKDPDHLRLRDIATIDQLHTGGHLATIDLCREAGFKPGMTILDAGCGIGGSSRLIADTSQCRVIGVDNVDEFIAAADFLTKSTGLEKHVSFEKASVYHLPFDDGTFDAVLCQHLLMNIEDKARVISEFRRVLKPGGKLVLHEITQTGDSPIHLPAPWAARHDISCLVTQETLDTILSENGFERLFYSDDREAAIEWWEKVKKACEKMEKSPVPLGPHILFGDNGIQFGRTMSANVREHLITVFSAVFVKKGERTGSGRSERN